MIRYCCWSSSLRIFLGVPARRILRMWTRTILLKLFGTPHSTRATFTSNFPFSPVMSPVLASGGTITVLPARFLAFDAYRFEKFGHHLSIHVERRERAVSKRTSCRLYPRPSFEHFRWRSPVCSHYIRHIGSCGQFERMMFRPAAFCLVMIVKHAGYWKHCSFAAVRLLLCEGGGVEQLMRQTGENRNAEPGVLTWLCIYENGNIFLGCHRKVITISSKITVFG